MRNNDELEHQPPLIRAAHRLREAQQLYDEGNAIRRDAALDMIDEALEDIRIFTHSEMEKMQ